MLDLVLVYFKVKNNLQLRNSIQINGNKLHNDARYSCLYYICFNYVWNVKNKNNICNNDLFPFKLELLQ